MAMGEDGVLFVADGPFSYSLKPGGAPQILGMLFTPGSRATSAASPPPGRASSW